MPTSQNGSSASATDVRWRVTTRTGAQFACCVQVIGARIEVQLTTEYGHSLATRVVGTPDAATYVARKWLRALLDNQDPAELSRNDRSVVVH
jgi:hypothetical protein